MDIFPNKRLGVYIFLLLLLVSNIYFAAPVSAQSANVCPAGFDLATDGSGSNRACIAPANADGTCPPNSTKDAGGGTGAYSNGSCTHNTAKPPATMTIGGCDGIVSCITLLPRLLFQYGMGAIALVFVYLSSWILSIAALLFNWLVQHTVIEFGSTYTEPVKKAVETAWTAFRDIANILIIGIFTFISISIILGLKEYGQKKMIAKVLIIAVLINFSLLATKMIVDASNFTATQIYTATALGNTQTSGATVNNNTKYGIGDQFLNLLGVGTLQDAWKTVSDTATAQNGWWGPFVHGVLLTAVLLGAAVVLFYGCFLLVSRMIMLIFLMVTASIAFASYLIPKWAGSNYGWSAWWSSLVWCAVFAPILMFLLWMTLSVANALKGNSTGTLGKALSDPTGDGNMSALFVYLAVLGLLFATFKVSSMVANKIGGLNFAQMASALPLTLGARLAGFGLRQTAGRFAALRSLKLDDQTDQIKAEARTTGNFRPLERHLRAKQRADARAGSSFNLMNTSPAKAAMAGIGISGFAAGADKKPPNFADSSKARAEKAAKEAAGLALSPDAKNEMEKRGVEHRKERREDLENRKKLQNEQITAIETALKPQTDPLKAERSREEGVKDTIEKKHDRILKALEKEIATSGSDAERTHHERDYAEASANKKSELAQQDNKIRTIDRQINELVEGSRVPEFQKAVHDLTKQIDDIGDNKKIQKDSKEEVTLEENKMRDVAAKTGASLAYSSFTSALQQIAGIDASKDTIAGKKAFKEVKKKIKQKKTSDMLSAMTDASGEATEAPAAGGDTADTH